MAITLMKDGKPLGILDGDTLQTEKERIHLEVEKDDLIEIPGDFSPPRRVARTEKLITETVADDDEVVDEPTKDDDRIANLENMVEALLRKLDTSEKPVREVEVVNLDLIPDDIPPEKDPYGIAKTLKNITKALDGMNKKVARLDQHAGYTEAMKQLDVEKGKFKVFKDKDIGGIATKLLEAELSTNRVDSMPKIVAKVAKEVGRLAVESTAKRVEEKKRTAERVPGVVRANDGTTPAITMKRPANIQEASAAYRAFREARGKANKG